MFRAPLGKNVNSSTYDNDESSDDEANEDYENYEEGEYTAAEWEAWEAPHHVREHDDLDHQLYQGGPDISGICIRGGGGVRYDYNDDDDDYCGAYDDSGGACGYENYGHYS
ncbi:hypothetical protein CYMTET_21464 [Cymbomonas tetramitiformis]|uniref:Uncharacterized protein n=1 Tax=Cymbomonas tetramitiformis TaxID=36881 RepID=A0AAE0L371_9CHLO|nr:hypothetical protein CYMTET_21464 [Cymbomonas tetramitiformis]